MEDKTRANIIIQYCQLVTGEFYTRTTEFPKSVEHYAENVLQKKTCFCGSYR